MNKKVLLLHCPGDKVYLHDYYTSYSSKANYYWQPYDLVLLSGVLSRFELRVIDAIADKMSEEKCLQRIKDFKPDVLIFTTGTATWKNDHHFIQRLRPQTSCLILASGSIFLFESDYFLNKMPEVDGAILDIVSLEIAEYIDGNVTDTPAIRWRNSNFTQVVPSVLRSKNFSIPIPRHDLFNLKANRSPLAKNVPFAIVVTSIGCPFSCHFCVAGSIAYRYRELDNVLAELSYLKSLGVKEIMFNDPTFTVSKKRVLQICQELLVMGKPFTWICNAHASTLSEELIEAMARAGCHTVMIGVESAHNETLTRCAKGVSPDKIIKVFRLCKKYGLRTLGYFIIGLPGDNRQTILQTINFAKQIDCDYASFAILTPDVGSKLRSEAIKKGILDPSIYEFDSTCFPVFTSGELSLEEIWRLRKKAFRDFYLRPSYLFKRIINLRSFKEFTFLLDQARSMFIGT
ncbi:MAG: radical SAM protein [Candidatus Aminicenantes bacterium]|nr:radical SAM protein [Candidatus Aminicenantes bacterium]